VSTLIADLALTWLSSPTGNEIFGLAGQ
jgi:hypothetical protein